jgi:hypothetical protein
VGFAPTPGPDADYEEYEVTFEEILPASVITAAERDPKPVRCSFCERAQTEVRFLFAGPGVYICDRCVDRSIELAKARGVGPPPPDPDEIEVFRHNDQAHD